ncbi:type 2 lanthipeptide synthetase LanM [uncultured Thiohalocapsa sp.]|uniref:type 2 lanthipeptide synthetase LanM n=1 Tax=uncultured Thiohalocapsa sp. TaxID=768990 RepID=UPI0025FAFE30|nr:type 2 lanthipeptide synthetase LanM [uncultured Thiohalocapsa sp.]
MNDHLATLIKRASAPFDSTFVPDALDPSELDDYQKRLHEVVSTRYGTVAADKRLNSLPDFDLPSHPRDAAPDVDYPNADWGRTLQAILTFAFTPAHHDAVFQPQEAPPTFPVLRPFLAYAQHQLQADLRNAELTCGARLDQPALEAHVTRLAKVSLRSIIYKIGLSRMPAFLSLGQEAPEDAYARFFEDVCATQESYLGFFADFPVLLRHLTIITAQHIATTTLFIQRLTADWEAIQRFLPLAQDSLSITDVELQLSDPHDSGYTVAAITLSSGERLFYKPRALAIDTLYGEVITWLNHRMGETHLRAAPVLDRGTYGWARNVPAQDCDDESAIRLYYYRFGILAALAFVLRGTDLHEENIVPHGSTPVPIDLETFFLGCLDLSELHFAETAPQYRTVNVGTTIIPPRFFSGASDSEAVAISPLTGLRPGQQWPVKAWRVRNHGRIDIQIEYYLDRPDRSQALPTLRGRKIPVPGYESALLDGFSEAYRLISQSRRDILKIIKRSAVDNQAVVRVMLRDSNEYGNTLFWCSAPDNMTSGLRYEAALEAVCGGGLPNELTHHHASIAFFEKLALWSQDLPRFSSQVNTRHLRSGHHRVISDCFFQSGLDAVEARLAQLSDADLSWQRELLRGSLKMAAAPLHRPAPVQRTGGADGMLNDEELFTDTARQRTRAAKVMHECLTALKALHVSVDGRPAWLTLLNPDKARSLHLTLAPSSSNQGSCGYTLFQAAALQSHQDPHPDQLHGIKSQVESALTDCKTLQTLTNLQKTGIEGLCSTTYLCRVTANLFPEQPTYAQDVAALIDHYEADSWYDIHSADFLSGDTANLMTLLLAFDLTGIERYLIIAETLGKHLVERCQLTDGPWTGGFSTNVSHNPVVGFAHGASGVAYALHRLSERIGAKAWIVDSIHNALAFERRMLDTDKGVWKSIWNGKETKLIHGWCNGPAGVGMSRIELLRSNLPVDRDFLLQDIDTAFGFLAHNYTAAHHMCCGEASVILFLIECTELDGERYPSSAVDAHVGKLLDHYDGHGWFRLQSLNSRPIIPGFLDGVSGIGFTLARYCQTPISFNPLLLR